MSMVYKWNFLYNKIFIPSSDIYTSSTNMEELDDEDY